MLLPFFNSCCIEGGLDEAGRGCLAGPVVAAAVILPSGYSNPLLNDSKQLDKLRRTELAHLVREEALAFSVGICSREEIDEYNILWASVRAMHKAVDLLTIRPDHLIVDGNRFKPYLGIPHTCVVKGDTKYQSIAAASILAKTVRDELMEKLALEFPEYGWEQNAGYPTIYHRKAIREFGITEHHRRSFRLLKD